MQRACPQNRSRNNGAGVDGGRAGAATITVCPSGCEYSKIQLAINASSVGDTIIVYSGTYYENVNVTKPLILPGIDNGSGIPVLEKCLIVRSNDDHNHHF